MSGSDYTRYHLRSHNHLLGRAVKHLQENSNKSLSVSVSVTIMLIQDIARLFAYPFSSLYGKLIICRCRFIIKVNYQAVLLIQSSLIHWFIDLFFSRILEVKLVLQKKTWRPGIDLWYCFSNCVSNNTRWFITYSFQHSNKTISELQLGHEFINGKMRYHHLPTCVHIYDKDTTPRMHTHTFYVIESGLDLFLPGCSCKRALIPI